MESNENSTFREKYSDSTTFELLTLLYIISLLMNKQLKLKRKYDIIIENIKSV